MADGIIQVPIIDDAYRNLINLVINAKSLCQISELAVPYNFDPVNSGIEVSIGQFQTAIITQAVLRSNFPCEQTTAAFIITPNANRSNILLQNSNGTRLMMFSTTATSIKFSQGIDNTSQMLSALIYVIN